MSSRLRSDSNSFMLLTWEKHEKIAMHFNELILKIRIQALGAIAAIVTIGGVLLKADTSSPNLPWGLIACVFAALFVFWIAIWLLDFLYYNRLLMGAVDCLLAIENAIAAGKPIAFEMSHKIEDAVIGKPPVHREKGSLRGPTLFYVIVAAVLFVGAAYSAVIHIRHAHQNNGVGVGIPLTYHAKPDGPPPHRLASQHRGDSGTRKPNTCPHKELA